MKGNIETIVRQVVTNYYKNQLIEQKQKPNKIFILLEGNNVIPPRFIWEIVSILSQKYSISICMEQGWQVPANIEYNECVVLEKENLELINKMVNETDLLFIPVASFSTLAKLALTMDDNLFLEILIQAQLDGRQIVVVKDSFIPKGTQKITIPHKVNQRLQAYMNILREDNVSIVYLKNALNWIDSYFESDIKSRSVVLAKHIEEVSKEGDSELLVPKNSLITPMGKEQAKNLRISIRQKE